jgi:hypothetical protein
MAKCVVDRALHVRMVQSSALSALIWSSTGRLRLAQGHLRSCEL